MPLDRLEEPRADPARGSAELVRAATVDREVHPALILHETPGDILSEPGVEGEVEVREESPDLRQRLSPRLRDEVTGLSEPSALCELGAHQRGLELRRQIVGALQPVLEASVEVRGVHGAEGVLEPARSTEELGAHIDDQRAVLHRIAPSGGPLRDLVSVSREGARALPGRGAHRAHGHMVRSRQCGAERAGQIDRLVADEVNGAEAEADRA
jgi:hypothetical protein